jgi:hypothetical protein
LKRINCSPDAGRFNSSRAFYPFLAYLSTPQIFDLYDLLDKQMRSMEMHTNAVIRSSVQAGMWPSITSLHGMELKLETNRPVLLDRASLPSMRHWQTVHRANKRWSNRGACLQAILFDRGGTAACSQ